MDKVLMQLGTTGEKGTDAKHFDLPSGIAVLKNGNIIVTDGYGNNRVLLFDKNGTLLKQVAKGAGGPADKGTGNGEWVLPHKLAVDAQENLYIIDRENKRVQVFDKNLPTFARSRTRAGTPGTSASRAKAPRASPTSPTTRWSACTRCSVRRQAGRHMGLAGTRARTVRLGPRHRRRLAGRGLRG